MYTRLFLSYVFLWTLVLVLEVSTRGHAKRTGNASQVAVSPPPPGGNKYPAVIIFGDSIADTGNNNYLPSLAKCNFLPYGRDFMGGIPTGRFSNGKISSDFIAKYLGIKELLPAYNDPALRPEDLLTGVSFASGGSGYDPLTSELIAVLPLPEQLMQFLEYKEKVKGIIGEERTNDLISKSLYGIISCSNDIANTYFDTHIRQTQIDFSSYSDFLVGKASEFVQKLYAAGARSILVFGAPPLGCTPSTRTLAGGILRQCSDEYNQASQMFNAKLNSLLTSLNANLSGATLLYVDAYKPLLEIIQNHQRYGFKVADRGCCGTGNLEVAFLCNQLSPFTCVNASDFIFWDSHHPTERAYEILTSIMLKNTYF